MSEGDVRRGAQQVVSRCTGGTVRPSPAYECGQVVEGIPVRELQQTLSH